MHEIKSIHEPKTMYKTALFVSSFIVVGVLLYLLGMNAGRMDLLFVGLDVKLP